MLLLEHLPMPCTLPPCRYLDFTTYETIEAGLPAFLFESPLAVMAPAGPARIPNPLAGYTIPRSVSAGCAARAGHAVLLCGPCFARCACQVEGVRLGWACWAEAPLLALPVVAWHSRHSSTVAGTSFRSSCRPRAPAGCSDVPLPPFDSCEDLFSDVLNITLGCTTAR